MRARMLKLMIRIITDNNDTYDNKMMMIMIMMIMIMIMIYDDVDNDNFL